MTGEPPARQRDWSALRGGRTRIGLGCDYNPEQWPRELWPQDVDLMRQAGLTFVTLGVFSWSLLEPEPGRFDLDWLGEVMDLLHAGGIAVDLATGTASPPPWLSHRHPETLPVDRDGRRAWPGGRQAWCLSSPVFRDRAVALAEAMATRFGDHPALALWHVGNEYGCHNAACYCDTCAESFRHWLAGAYPDLEALNAAWGTAFWSQRYGDLAQVLPPRRALTPSNPSQVLDYARFCSDALLGQFLAERDVLRRVCPDVPVTTNFMTLNHFRDLDYHRWASEQDVVSTDHYLVATQVDAEAELAFSGDLTRGLARGEPWVLMEHSTSAVNWQPVNPAKQPGQMLRNAVSHLAHGADALGFFQWRASQAGTEKYHSALLPHAGTDTRIWRDVMRLGSLVERLDGLAGTRVSAEVAILWDYAAGWALNQPSQPSELVRYGDEAQALHAALLRHGIAADVVHPHQDLTGYRLVIAATLYACDDRAVRGISDAVHAGSDLLVTYYSGIVDEHDRVRLGGYPGALRDLLGIRVEEFWPLLPGERVLLDDGATGGIWSEDLRLEQAAAVARYAHGPLAGVPATTRRDADGATRWYLATSLRGEDLDRFVSMVIAQAGVEAPVDAAHGVERVVRTGESGSYLFLINHTDRPVQVAAHGVELVSAHRVDGTLTLAGGGCAVVRQSSNESS